MIIKIEKNNNFTVVSNEIYKNPNISARAKGIYGYIMTLPVDWHLQLTHIYNQFSEGRDAIQKALSELEENGYIVKKKVKKNGKENGGWDITFFENVKNVIPLTENPYLLIEKDISNSNTINSNSNTIVNSNINSNTVPPTENPQLIKKDNSNITIDSPLKTEIRKLFSELYESKTKEVTGTAAKMPWSGKEASLLKIDLTTHGLNTLKKYIYIFFSDKDNSIADFTRHKNCAGYSFAVFHGMLGKLALSKVKIKAPCKHCGRVGRHDPNCKITIDILKKVKIEIDEINRLKDENKDLSLIKSFEERINRQI